MNDYTNRKGIVDGTTPVRVILHWPLFGEDHLLVESLNGARDKHGHATAWTTLDQVVLTPNH